MNATGKVRHPVPVSRAGFISRDFDGGLPAPWRRNCSAPAAAGDAIGRFYGQREYGKAMREIMPPTAPTAIDDCKPWVLARDPADRRG